MHSNRARINKTVEICMALSSLDRNQGNSGGEDREEVRGP